MTPRGLPHHMTAAECERLRRLREIHTIETCALLMGRSSEAVRRCIKRGFQPYVSPRRRPRPTDFALVANKMRLIDLAHHYGTSLCAVRRWAGEINRPDKWRGRPKAIPVPDDLAETLDRLGLAAATRHYGVCQGVMQRWREKAGLPVKLKARTIARRRRSEIGWVDQYAAERRAQSRSNQGDDNVRYRGG